MELILKFAPKDEFSSKLMAEGLTDQQDFQDFLRHNIGKSITATFKLSQSIPEKQRMYDFYHRVVLGVAMQVYTDLGWESMDKVKADYLLKAECGKGIMYNPVTEEEEVYLLDKSRMNKDRLRKYLTDCITYLEVEMGAIVPDSSSYKMELRSGISGFQSINQRKKGS